jgi:FkbM family methyltransferase
MEHYNDIKKWDDEFCTNHVVNLVRNITKILKEKNITNLSYIDIGANVGKVYDLLSENFVINKVWMYEASPILFEYIKEKYSSDSKVIVNNNVVLDRSGKIQFDQSSLIYEINNNQHNLNLGLSKIGNSNHSTEVDSIKISDVILNTSEIQNDVTFIKIDTENVDFNILNDLFDVIRQFKNKPIIEFEINYFVSNMSISDAQFILDKYVDLGYNKIDLRSISGDGILIP